MSDHPSMLSFLMQSFQIKSKALEIIIQAWAENNYDYNSSRIPHRPAESSSEAEDCSTKDPFSGSGKGLTYGRNVLFHGTEVVVSVGWRRSQQLLKVSRPRPGTQLGDSWSMGVLKESQTFLKVADNRDIFRHPSGMETENVQWRSR